MTFGFDISKYQDNPETPAIVDFQKMKSYGASFVILRAGHAVNIDREWVKHVNNSAGILPRASYWYYDPYFPPLAQANKYLEALDGIALEGRCWLDLEFTWQGAYSSPQHWGVFRDAIAKYYRVGWYTRKSWWDSRVGAYASIFSRDPLWVAQYSSQLTMIPKGWTRWMLWQNGTPAIGIEAGTESKEIDYNIWNDLFLFEEEWGRQEPVPSKRRLVIEGDFTVREE